MRARGAARARRRAVGARAADRRPAGPGRAPERRRRPGLAVQRRFRRLDRRSSATGRSRPATGSPPTTARAPRSRSARRRCASTPATELEIARLDDTRFNLRLRGGSVAARLRNPQRSPSSRSTPTKGAFASRPSVAIASTASTHDQRRHRLRRPGDLRGAQHRPAGRPRPARAVLDRRAPACRSTRWSRRRATRSRAGTTSATAPRTAVADDALRLAGDDRRRGPRPLRPVAADARIRRALGAALGRRRLGAVQRRPLGLGSPVGLDLGRRRALGLRAVPLRPLGLSPQSPGAGRRAPTSRGRSTRRRWWRGSAARASTSRSRSAAGAPVGWFPLAPREVYVPAYRSSPRYVRDINVTHVTNVTQLTTIVSNRNGEADRRDFANRKYPHAVTFVPAERDDAARAGRRRRRRACATIRRCARWSPTRGPADGDGGRAGRAPAAPRPPQGRAPPRPPFEGRAPGGAGRPARQRAQESAVRARLDMVRPDSGARWHPTWRARHGRRRPDRRPARRAAGRRRVRPQAPPGRRASRLRSPRRGRAGARREAAPRSRRTGGARTARAADRRRRPQGPAVLAPQAVTLPGRGAVAATIRPRRRGAPIRRRGNAGEPMLQSIDIPRPTRRTAAGGRDRARTVAPPSPALRSAQPGDAAGRRPDRRDARSPTGVARRGEAPVAAPARSRRRTARRRPARSPKGTIPRGRSRARALPDAARRCAAAGEVRQPPAQSPPVDAARCCGRCRPPQRSAAPAALAPATAAPPAAPACARSAPAEARLRPGEAAEPHDSPGSAARRAATERRERSSGRESGACAPRRPLAT